MSSLARFVEPPVHGPSWWTRVRRLYRSTWLKLRLGWLLRTHKWSVRLVRYYVTHNPELRMMFHQVLARAALGRGVATDQYAANKAAAEMMLGLFAVDMESDPAFIARQRALLRG